MEGERKQVTVLFADLSGFTAMSEKMDPEDITSIMNECFRLMGTSIEKHGGTIDKFMGDCVMALFGAPKALEDAPHRAIETAFDMRSRLQRFSEDKHLPIPLSFHIGINTGPVIAGMIGSDSRQDFTVMGDTVNVASRMANAAEPGTVLIAENTFRLTEGYFDFEPVGEVQIKGKGQSVKAYKVLCPRRTITRIKACMGKGLSPFVGRTRELHQLNNCLEQVQEGHGQVVGVVGEPGVGKTRLISQFRESLPAQGYTFIEGGCIHYGETIPYLPILDILRDYFDIGEDEAEVTIKKKINDRVTQLSGQLSHILPPIYEVLSLKEENEGYVKLNAKQRRDRVFDAIRLFLIAESGKNPLIVIIEDLQWMDKTSEEFLTYFINSLATTRVMLILLFRPEYNPAAWVTKTYCSQVRVDQLPRKAIADLIKGNLKGGDVEPELLEFIVKRTEGNPLFIEEMTCNLLENGSIRKDDNRYSLILKPTDIQVPATIQGIIAARLDRLEGALKGVMQTASVIGREFAFRILQAVATLKEDLKSSLLTLQDLEFIYEKSIFPELEYIFKHTLTQEVAYNSLLIKRRKETHERVGQAIETIYGDRLEEFYEMLAYHYSLSENAQKAFQYLKFSGDKATKNYSNVEAVRFYKEAVRALDAQIQSEENKKEKLKIFHLIFNPMGLLGYPEDMLDILQAAEGLAQELKDNRSLARVYGDLGNYHAFKGNPELGIEYSEKYFDQAEKIGDISNMALIAAQVCTANILAGNFLKVVDVANKVLPLLEEQLHEKDLSEGKIRYSTITKYSLLSGQAGGLAMGYLGMFEEGKKVLARGFQAAYEADARWTGWLEAFHSNLSYCEGDVDTTIAHAENAIQYFEKTGNNLFAGYLWSVLGSGYYLRGDYTTAIQHVEKGIRIQKQEGVPTLLPHSYVFLASGYSAIGDLVHARRSAEEGLNIAQNAKTKGFEGLLWMVLGSIMGKADPAHIDDATYTIQKGISILEERKARALSAQGYLFLGELFADVGRKKEALENLKKSESMYLEIKVTPKSYWLKRTREALAKLGQ